MNGLTDEQKDAIWKELLAELDKDELRPGEKTLKMIMEEKGIKYDRARKYMRKLVERGLIGTRVTANKQIVYYILNNTKGERNG